MNAADKRTLKMDMQTAFNIVGAIAGFLMVWVLTGLKGSMEQLQEADMVLASKIQDMEVLVAGEYVKRAEVEKDLAAIFKVCQRIEDKLDKKVDK